MHTTFVNVCLCPMGVGVGVGVFMHVYLNVCIPVLFTVSVMW